METIINFFYPNTQPPPPMPIWRPLRDKLMKIVIKQIEGIDGITYVGQNCQILKFVTELDMVEVLYRVEKLYTGGMLRFRDVVSHRGCTMSLRTDDDILILEFKCGPMKGPNPPPGTQMILSQDGCNFRIPRDDPEIIIPDFASQHSL